MAKSKTKISETLEDFLFNKIENDPKYGVWSKNYDIPEYISDNLNPSKKLREYQQEALKHFIWLYENDRANAKRLLFNMATGTGKTLVMAGVMLYLYEKGYRNFMFLVHQVQIKDQAIRNFTNYKFEKYLFNPKGIRINGQNVDTKIIDKMEDSSRNSINFLFYSTQLLYNRINEERENTLTIDDFVNNNIVIIADEAHRLNVDTRSKNKKDKKEALNWEKAVVKAVESREENLLLEFTATVDLANQAIHEKYKDKIVHRYDFLHFNKDGYSKDVKFLYNQEVHIEDQKRLLIINAVALSEYRRLLAEKDMGQYINPIVLIKSKKIAQSVEDRDFFDKVIESIRPEDLDRLKEITRDNNGREHEILSDMFKWLGSKSSGLVSNGDWDGLKAFIAEIKSSFTRENTLIYNSQKKENPDSLTTLDNPLNSIRAIFSVNALNEGWDVLSLFDIIHFDISETKKVSLQDIQLIGRGARYCPFELPRRYKVDEDSEMSLFGGALEFDKYKRKFDNDPYDRGRVLETFVYHFVKTGTFLENLQKDLLGEGIINEGVEKKTINLKDSFIESETYKKGFVLVNSVEKRKKTAGREIDTTFNRVIKAGSYNLRAKGLSDYEQNQIIAGQKTAEIKITEDFFSIHLIRKALVSAESNFFRYNNLAEHITDLKSMDDLILRYLPMYNIKYTFEEGKSIDKLSPTEKMQLMIGVILPEVRKAIDINMPKETGSKEFRPVALSQIFQKEKSIYLMSFPVAVDKNTGEKIYASTDERAIGQSEHLKADLQLDIGSADWYAYNENYGTSEEKRFVKYFASQVDDLKKRYPGSEIYLLRNELDYWLFSTRDGRRFSPDYLLFINDIINKEIYYQCIIEPKGGHLLEQDEWKEGALLALNSGTNVVFESKDGDKEQYKEYLAEMKKNGYREIRCIGLEFYNSDSRGEESFALDFQKNLLTN